MWLVSFFYPFWGTVSLIAGIALIVIAKALSRGEGWARGLAMILLSLPSIGGAYMIVPWMNFVGSAQGGFPPAVFIMMVGLVGYFTLLLCQPGDWKQKLVDFLVFLMLGVAAAQNFANGHAAFEILQGIPTDHCTPKGSRHKFRLVRIMGCVDTATLATYQLR